MGHKVKQSLMSSRIDFFYYAFRNILIIILPLFTISVLVLSLSHSSATNSSADHLDFSIPVSCTLSSNIESAHSATLLNGTYKDNIGKTTLTTYCNDQNGYTIYASAMSKNSSGQSVLVSSDSSTYDIITGTATSGSDSAWAMKLNNVEGDTSPTPPTIEPGYLNTYTVVPNTWTKVASKSNGTVNSQTGSSFTTTYAVYTSTAQPAGSYIGLVRYMLLHDNQTIPEPTYFMQDVAFWKDNLALNQSIQAIDERDGKKYWVTKLADGNIWMTQNLDLCIGCEGVAALTSENTDLADHSLTGAYLDGYSYDPVTDITTWVPNSETAITSNRVIDYNTNTVTNWTDNNNIPYSAEGGDTYFYTSGNNGPDIKFSSLKACEGYGYTEANCLHYHVGNYYNWSAAIASNNSSPIASNGDRANNSICPRGWRLPNTSTTDDIYNEFGKLFYTYDITNNKAGSTNVGYKTGGFNAIRVSPLWFVRSGYINNTTIERPAIGGNYESNTVYGAANSFGLFFSAGEIFPNGYSYSQGNFRPYGRSIRCLARQEN